MAFRPVCQGKDLLSLLWKARSVLDDASIHKCILNRINVSSFGAAFRESCFVRFIGTGGDNPTSASYKWSKGWLVAAECCCILMGHSDCVCCLRTRIIEEFRPQLQLVSQSSRFLIVLSRLTIRGYCLALASQLRKH